jgi:DNA-binding transcriptional MerR regulator
MDHNMMIGELAARSGLPQSRIRFYEAQGLLVGARRRTNGYREFNERALHVLEVIRGAQDAGFKLEEIRPLLPINDDMDKWDRDKILKALRHKVSDIESLEQRLKKNKAQLMAIIDLVVNKPDDVDCVDNAERVIAILRK